MATILPRPVKGYQPTTVQPQATQQPVAQSNPLNQTYGGGVPDPYNVAATQQQLNNNTAAYNNAIQHGNTTTPLGSQTFTSRIDPVTGATVYDSNIALTPAQQQLLDQQNQQDLSLGETQSNMLGTINSTYSTPMDYSKLPGLFGASDLLGARDQTQDALYGKHAAYLDPQYEARAKALESQLANQGVGLGSEAWRAAQDDLSRDRTFSYDDARRSAITGGLNEMTGLSDIASKNRAQLLSEALTARAQPLNEFNALRDTTQVQMPTFDTASERASALTQTPNIMDSVYRAYENSQANRATNMQAGLGLAGTILDASGGIGGLVDGARGLFGIGAPAAAAAPAAAGGVGLTGLGSGGAALGAGATTGAASAAGALPTGGLMAGIGSGGSTGAAAAGGAGAAGAGGAAAGGTGYFGLGALPSLGIVGGLAAGLSALTSNDMGPGDEYGVKGQLLGTWEMIDGQLTKVPFGPGYHSPSGKYPDGYVPPKGGAQRMVGRG